MTAYPVLDETRRSMGGALEMFGLLPMDSWPRCTITRTRLQLS